MPAINSTSTLAQLDATNDDDASYAEDAPSAARAFMTACRILLRRYPAEAGTRQSHVRLSPEQLGKRMAEAKALIQTNDTTTAGARG